MNPKFSMGYSPGGSNMLVKNGIMRSNHLMLYFLPIKLVKDLISDLEAKSSLFGLEHLLFLLCKARCVL